MSVDGSAARALFDLSRARQALLSVAQPALGALLALGALPDTRTVVLGLVAACAGYLAVFSLNDVLDLRSDVQAIAAGKGDFDGFDIDTAFDRHPLAAGTLRLRVALMWVCSLSVIAAWFAWALSPLAVLIFGMSVGLEALYCALRSVTWAKTFVSGVMVGLGGLAGWVAVAPLDARALGFFGFLAVWEIAGRNLPNDLSDLRADRAVGLKTVATTFGPSVSAGAIAAGGVMTAALALTLPTADPARLGSLVMTVTAMSIPAFALVRLPAPAAAARYFNRASLVPALVFLVVLAAVVAGPVS